MAIKIKVSGINILLQDLDKYEQEVQRMVADEVRLWAERTEADAKRDVPRDTNALANSIRAVSNPNRLSWAVKAGGINGVNYAPYVEFGTGTFVNEAFLQEYGLVKYASDFRGKGVRKVNLPMRSFLYKNARAEFEKTFQAIKKILQATEK